VEVGPFKSLSFELRHSEAAFDALDDYLVGERFWKRRDVEADLFLAYGLSEPLRRTTTPSPPEPCLLPLLACRIRNVHDRTPTVPGSDEFTIGAWERSWSDDDYAAAIESVRGAIARGDLYQANLVQHLAAPFDGDVQALGRALAPLRPLVSHPLVGDGWAIVSASPELFLSRRGNLIVTKPIKGTRPSGEDVDHPKDSAEHTMIVDLERNDLARICEPGSIRWPELRRQHELAGVAHLVSTVEGQLRSGVSLAEILSATFPGGSVTGAPKIAALDLIAALEPVGRGASMGALGVLRPSGDLTLR
jgi:para-aminobenzoate synthetase component 1